MPGDCSQNDSPDGLYFTKHDPFVYFDPITGDSGSGNTSAYCDAHVVPFTQFWGDLSTSNLPNYSFITPNICDDAESRPLSTGDRWLSTVVPRIVNSSAFASTALFIVYDEGTNNASFGPNAGVRSSASSFPPFARVGMSRTSSIPTTRCSPPSKRYSGRERSGVTTRPANIMSDLFSIPLQKGGDQQSSAG